MIATIVYYVIRGHTKPDFSEKYIPAGVWNKHTLEYVAEQIAEDFFHDDPCDPENFEVEVGVRFEGVEKWFRITAEAEVSFYPEELTHGSMC